MEDKKSNSIDDALGLPPEETEENLPVENEKNSTEIVTTSDEETDDYVKDVELARQNIQNIISQGDDSLVELISLAKQSESPRAFEVAANLMKTLLDANKDFISVSEKKKTEKQPKENPTNNITNNNLILSTEDVLKQLTESNKNK